MDEKLHRDDSIFFLVDICKLSNNIFSVILQVRYEKSKIYTYIMNQKYA